MAIKVCGCRITMLLFAAMVPDRKVLGRSMSDHGGRAGFSYNSNDGSLKINMYETSPTSGEAIAKSYKIADITTKPADVETVFELLITTASSTSTAATNVTLEDANMATELQDISSEYNEDSTTSSSTMTTVMSTTSSSLHSSSEEHDDKIPTTMVANVTNTSTFLLSKSEYPISGNISISDFVSAITISPSVYHGNCVFYIK